MLFVEGGEDKAFLDSLLDHLDVANVSTVEIGGGVSKLQKIKPNLSRALDSGNRIAVILDADSDFSNRRDEFLKCKNQFGLPIDRFFLLPDHKTSGCLETLLEQMAVPSHRGIYKCFDKYKTCLWDRGKPYCLPKPKARIYAYCEALGIETRGTERSYEDSLYWDLDVPELDPLKQFLYDL